MRKLLAALCLLSILHGACGTPVPPDKAAYVGEWRSTIMALSITQGGSVSYRRREGNKRTSINAPLKSFKGNDFEVGVGPASTVFVVSVTPHIDGGVWKMTVDGVELSRPR